MRRVEEVLKSTVLLSVTTPCDDSCHIRWWGSSRLRIINLSSKVFNLNEFKQFLRFFGAL